MNSSERGYKDIQPIFLENETILNRDEDDHFDRMPENPSKQVSNLYDDNLRASDEIFLERLIKELKNSGEYDDTLLIITADHGQLFAEETIDFGEFDNPENFWGHGDGLHHEQNIRLPLMVKFPGQQEGRVDERLVSLIDILPTALESANITYDEEAITGIPLQEDNTRERLYLSTHELYTRVSNNYKITWCKNYSNIYCDKVTGENDYSLFEYQNKRSNLIRKNNEDLARDFKSEIDEYLENYQIDSLEKYQEDKEVLEDRFRELGYIE